MPEPRVSTSVPVPVIVLAALFVVVLASIVAASLGRERVAVFDPSAARVTPLPAATTRLVRDTVTIDARDESRWQFFGFARGPLAPPDTSGWDLAFRRFHVLVAGGVADLGETPFDQVDAAPESGYVATVLGRDTLNPAVARWYRYSMVSHLLEPKRRTYVVRTRDGQYAKLEFLGYYCPGPSAGCVTFQYAYQGVGGRLLATRRPPSHPGGGRPALP
ncbi:MAG: HmuY family protein [Gemmatimonadales bacterium]